MAKLKLPFELEKPSADEYVTQASQIGMNGKSLDEFLGDMFVYVDDDATATPAICGQAICGQAICGVI